MADDKLGKIDDVIFDNTGDIRHFRVDGPTRERSRYYENALRNGGALVTVNTDPANREKAQSVLRICGAVIPSDVGKGTRQDHSDKQRMLEGLSNVHDNLGVSNRMELALYTGAGKLNHLS